MLGVLEDRVLAPQGVVVAALRVYVQGCRTGNRHRKKYGYRQGLRSRPTTFVTLGCGHKVNSTGPALDPCIAERIRSKLLYKGSETTIVLHLP